MTRKRLAITLLVSVSVALLVFWIGSHTYWEDIKVPMPPKGEALVNPFYAAQRFAEKLGATTATMMPTSTTTTTSSMTVNPRRFEARVTETHSRSHRRSPAAARAPPTRQQVRAGRS